MMTKIWKESRYLIFILCIVIFGFSQAFYLLSFDVLPDAMNNSSNDFDNPAKSVLFSFAYMMGNANFNNMGNTINYDLGQFLLAVFITMTTIILLNVLIAIMSDTYRTVQTNLKAEWLLERCRFMIDMPEIFHDIPKQYTYCLVRKSMHKPKDYIQDVLEKVEDVKASQRLQLVKQELQINTAHSNEEKHQLDHQQQLKQMETRMSAIAEDMKRTMQLLDGLNKKLETLDSTSTLAPSSSAQLPEDSEVLV
jgi:hypothetical protein